MDVLATGCFPSCDEEGRAFEEGSHLAMRAGSRIAGNWTFRFAGFKADWEARVVCHKFERNYAANLICDQCPASRGGVHNFGNLMPDAPYRNVSWTHEEYIHMCSRHRVSGWVHVKGWRRERNLEDIVWRNMLICKLCVFQRFPHFQSVSIPYFHSSGDSLNPIFEDLLHILHQGVACVAIPSLISDHIEAKYPNCTLKDLDRALLGEVWNSYRSWCRANRKTPCSFRFNLTKFGREQWNVYPELGSIYKAACVRDMIHWTSAYLHDNLHTCAGSEDRCYCMHSLAAFQRNMDEAPEFFHRQKALETANYARTFLMFYQRLASLNRSRGEERRNYKITPKFHNMVHLADYIETSLRNPRFLVKKGFPFAYNLLAVFG